MIARSLDLPAVFATIFDRHVDAVHRFVGYRVRPSEVDDTVAEVFRIAFEDRHRFEPSALSAKPWLLGIATNVARRSHRSFERGHRAVQRAAASSVGPSDPLLAVDDRLDAADLIDRIAPAIRQLLDVEREVLLMTVWDELAPTEIAEALRIPPATVRTHLFRARKRLRRALDLVDRMPEASSTAQGDVE